MKKNVPSQEQLERLDRIKAFAVDCDGVLTDCRIWWDEPSGQWRRFFSIRDGFGLKSLRENGYEIAIITTSDSDEIRARAKQLKIPHLFEGVESKLPSFQELLERCGLSANEVAYMGDDHPDIPLLQECGFAFAPPEALPRVLDVADYVAERPGGNGAVREACELILEYGYYAKK